MKKVSRWYIYPLDSHTNATIAARLDEGRSMTEINCADRKRRPVWECDLEFVDILRNSMVGAKLKFHVFKQTSDGRIVRDTGKSKITAKALTKELLKTVRRMAPQTVNK